MSDFLTAGDSAELCFGLGLIVWGMAWLIARHINQRRHVHARRAAKARALAQYVEPCTHPAWRVERLAYKGAGQALRISCVRCRAPALDRFTWTALSDGTISIVNRTSSLLLVVIDGMLHELLPPEEWSAYEDDAQESTYAVFLQPPDDLDSAYLRKL